MGYWINVSCTKGISVLLDVGTMGLEVSGMAVQ